MWINIWKKNWTRSRGKRKACLCNNRYSNKGQVGCQNNHIDEGMLEKAFMMSVSILKENRELLQSKWNKLIENDSRLKQYYSNRPRDIVSRKKWNFNGGEMCLILDGITISEKGEISVEFLEGTEVNL